MARQARIEAKDPKVVAKVFASIATDQAISPPIAGSPAGLTLRVVPRVPRLEKQSQRVKAYNYPHQKGRGTCKYDIGVGARNNNGKGRGNAGKAEPANNIEESYDEAEPSWYEDEYGAWRSCGTGEAALTARAMMQTRPPVLLLLLLLPRNQDV